MPAHSAAPATLYILDQTPVEMELPPGVSFADLNLRRAPDGFMHFDTSVFAVLCQYHQIDASRLSLRECAYILHMWYRAHRHQNGETCPTMEILLLEWEAIEIYGAMRVPLHATFIH